MTKLIFVACSAFVLLVLLPLTNANAAETPQQHKSIDDKMHKMMAGILVSLACDHSTSGIAAIGDLVDNDTAFIEECLK